MSRLGLYFDNNALYGDGVGEDGIVARIKADAGDGVE